MGTYITGRGDYAKRGRGRLVTAGGGASEVREGVLQGAAFGPACLTDSPPAVFVAIYERDSATRKLEPTGENTLVYMTDPDLSAPAGAYCRFQRIGGIEQIVWLSCSDSTAGCNDTSSSSSGSTIR